MKAKTLVKIIVSLALIVALIIFAGPEQILDSASTANPFFLFIALLTTHVIFVFKFLKWNAMCRIGANVPIKKTSSIYLVGSFFGMVTPSKVGELIKFHYLSKQGMPKASALSISVSDKAFDILMITIFSVIGVFMISGGAELFGPFVVISIILILIATYMVFDKRVFLKIGGFVLRRSKIITNALKIKRKADSETLEDFYQPLQKMKSRPLLIAYMLLMTFLLWFFVAVQVLFILLAFGSEINIIHSLITVCVGAVVGLIPITVSGVGTRDAAIMAILATIGIGSGIAILSSIIYTFFSMVIPAIIGGIIYLKSKEYGEVND